jgi:hypothetical protein
MNIMWKHQQAACQEQREKSKTVNTHSHEVRVFWDVAPCSHTEVDRRYRGAYCLHHQGDE